VDTIIAAMMVLGCLFGILLAGGIIVLTIKFVEDAIKVARGSRSHYNLVIAIAEWWHQKSDPRWVAWREWK